MKLNDEIIFLDYNSTHPPFTDIIKASYENYFQNYYNPSGISKYSLARQGLIEDVRNSIEAYTGQKNLEIIFSSTGTEANYLLVNIFSKLNIFDHVILSPFEHPSLMKAWEARNVKISFINTDSSGLINMNHLEELCKKSPGIVSILHVSNETGVIQPIKEIRKITNQYNLPFVSDLMQSYSKLELDFSLFDGFTFSGHKIGAGLGTAVTCIKNSFIKNSRLSNNQFSIFQGGFQENEFRAGTENIVSILSLQGAMIKQKEVRSEKEKKLNTLQTYLEENLKNIDIKIIAENSSRLTSTSFVILPELEVDFFLMGMDDHKIIISTGSSCKSRAREASPSLLKMGYSKDEALRAIRISTGLLTTMNEVEYFLETTNKLVKKLMAFL